MSPDITQQMVEDAERRHAEPEGVSVFVVGPKAVSEAVAREVAPELARRIYPDRIWGDVLHVERISRTSWEVVVRDRGPKRPR